VLVERAERAEKWRELQFQLEGGIADDEYDNC